MTTKYLNHKQQQLIANVMQVIDQKQGLLALKTVLQQDLTPFIIMHDDAFAVPTIAIFRPVSRFDKFGDAYGWERIAKLAEQHGEIVITEWNTRADQIIYLHSLRKFIHQKMPKVAKITPVFTRAEMQQLTKPEYTHLLG